VQKDLSVLLPAVAAAVVLADGGLEWRAALGAPVTTARARLVAAAPAAVALLALAWFSADDLDRWREQYVDGVALDQPGADGIRGPAADVAAVDAALELLDGCDQFAMYPAWNSLYLFTGTPPPTGYNATAWEELLSDEEQEATIEALEAADGRVCFLRLAGFPAVDPEERPLLVYLESYEPAGTDGVFELSVRPEP
jgi:hypothetical protein